MATATVTLDQARLAVEKETRRRNQKIVEAIPAMIAKLAKEKQVYIFNVGPRPWNRSLGSLGNFHVPACLEGAKVSAPLKIDGVILERVAIDMNKMGNRYEEGIDVAHDVLFMGRGYVPELSGENWGLFITDSPTPSPVEIKAAQAKLRTTQARLVDEGDALDRQNKRHEITDMHRDAAKALGVNRSWMSQEPREVANCPACQKPVDIEAVACPACGAVLDWERAKIYFPEKYVAYKAAQAAK